MFFSDKLKLVQRKKESDNLFLYLKRYFAVAILDMSLNEVFVIFQCLDRLACTNCSWDMVHNTDV